MKEYIEERNGGLYVTGTRISLDSVVYLFKEGSSPETILDEFRGLSSLENVYGAILYYLANKDQVEAYLKKTEEKWAEFARQADPPPAVWRERWEQLKAERLKREQIGAGSE